MTDYEDEVPALPPGEDISIARNYRDGGVWIQAGDGPRKLLLPDTARELARRLEQTFDLHEQDEQGYETSALADDLREAADDVEQS